MTRSSGVADARRTLRFRAAAALAVMLAATVIQLDQPGPGRVLAALAGLAALCLVVRSPRLAGAYPDRAGRLHAAARLILVAGLVVVIGAFAASHASEQRARIAVLCTGQSAQLGPWRLTLAGINPVAGAGFTALQADLAARIGAGEPVLLAPQLRTGFGQALQADAPARARLWNGDLSLRFTGYDAASDCMALDALWRPFAGLARLGGWLAALGAAALALVALGSLRWRRRARARIAMRREDRPLAFARRPASKLPKWTVPAAVLCLVPIGYAVLHLPRSNTAALAAPSFARGAALVAARQSLVDGPANLNRWIVIADAMARRGHFFDAAEVLLGAVESAPRDPQGWLALGDALYGHAGGQLTPAAALAYARADRAAAGGGAARSIAALAMARSGRAELAARWLEQTGGLRQTGELRQTGGRTAP